MLRSKSKSPGNPCSQILPMLGYRGETSEVAASSGGILIGSAGLAELAVVTNRRTQTSLLL